MKGVLMGLMGLCVSVSLGCAPETLEGFEPPEPTNNSTSNNTSTNNSTSGGTFTTEFVNVTSILTDNCTQAACHGQFAANGFVVPTDQNATPEEMRQALEGKRANMSGELLINPGNPDTSDIWARMSLPTTDNLYMPSTKAVIDGASMTLLQTWIQNGAVYTQ
jgi:hypothetical protein